MSRVFIGYTRFSVVSEASKAWVISQRSDYLDRLFNSERLRVRINLFNASMQNIALAKEKTSIRVFHIVYYSSSLPDFYKKELEEMAMEYPFLVLMPIDITEDFSHLKGINTVVRENSLEESILGIYNLDDDDFLSVNYFSHSEKYLSNNFLNYRVSYALGLTAKFDNVRFFNVEESYLPKINIGILTICKYENNRVVWPHGGSHVLIDRKGPVILDSTEYMYIWTRHYHQDTNANPDYSYKLSAQMLLSDTSVPKDLWGKAFPSLKHKLFHEHLLEKWDEKELAFKIISSSNGLLKIGLEFECMTRENKPLISFKFTEEDRKLIDNENYNELGFYKSDNEEYGFYRYLDFNNENSRCEIIVDVPKYIDNFELKLYERGERMVLKNIKIHSLT